MLDFYFLFSFSQTIHPDYSLLFSLFFPVALHFLLPLDLITLLSLQKRAAIQGLLRTSSIAKSNKFRYNPSYKGFIRQPRRKKRISIAGDRVKNIHTPVLGTPHGTPANNHNIFPEDLAQTKGTSVIATSVLWVSMSLLIWFCCLWFFGILDSLITIILFLPLLQGSLSSKTSDLMDIFNLGSLSLCLVFAQGPMPSPSAAQGSLSCGVWFMQWSCFSFWVCITSLWMNFSSSIYFHGNHGVTFFLNS